MERLREGQINLSVMVTRPEITERHSASLQRSIARETIENRGLRGFKQYGRFFVLFWAYGLLEPERARLLKSSYFWLRHVDDIADGDKDLPAGYVDKQQYLHFKRQAAVDLFSGKSDAVVGDREDLLLVDYLLASRKLGIDLRKESLAVLDTIIFDEERARNRRVPSQQELDDYFQKLDFACVEGAIKVAGDNIPPTDLADLSWATRTVFNLRDFPRDFAQGIINISREDVDRYMVDVSKLEGRDSVYQLVVYGPMRRWYADQTAAGLGFLERAKDRIDGLNLKRVSRMALELNFVKPAQRTLSGYSALLATASHE